LPIRELLLLQSFTDKTFEKFRQLIHENSGICFGDAKKDTLRVKLEKLMSKNRICSYNEYYNMLVADKCKRLIMELVNEITINKTNFFRENNHFDFIRNKIQFIMEKNQRILKNKEIRVWSTACSTGEEAYSIAITLKDCLPDEINIRILATDICSNVLSTALKGIYPLHIKDEVGNSYVARYFENTGDSYKVADEIKNLITFRQFNLMDLFPFTNTFDMIFCRNVIIYFDSGTQQSLVEKFYNITTPGGLLFLGHSESLINKKHRYQYIQPTIYMK